MQGFDPQTILPRIAAQGLERQEIRPGDWFDDDGMLMCGKCGEPRQGMVTVSAPMEGNPENKMTFKATRSCKCDRDKEAAEKQAEAGTIDKATKKRFVVELLEANGITVTPEIDAFIEAAVKELDLAEKNAIGEIGKIFSDAEQTPQN